MTAFAVKFDALTFDATLPMGGARTTWPRGRRPACGKVDEQSVQLVYRTSHALQFLLLPTFVLRQPCLLLRDGANLGLDRLEVLVGPLRRQRARRRAGTGLIAACRKFVAWLTGGRMTWRTVTRSRSPSSAKNQPVPAMPGVARAGIGSPTVVTSRSRHSSRVSISTDHGLMGVSGGGGGDSYFCCCCYGSPSAKRDTTETRISTSTSMMPLAESNDAHRPTTTAPSCTESVLGRTPIHRTTGG